MRACSHGYCLDSLLYYRQLLHLAVYGTAWAFRVDGTTAVWKLYGSVIIWFYGLIVSKVYMSTGLYGTYSFG